MSNWVYGLHFNNIRGDVFGGITAAIVALPLALAFGVASGAGPIAGMYGAIFVGLFAALFGGTPSQVSGPTGPMTVVMAPIFTQYTQLDSGTGFAMAFTVVMMAGVIQILMGVCKVGRYINLVPFPVISGFMSGIGVIIILLQLAPLMGDVTPKGGPLMALQYLPDVNFQLDAFILAALTLAIVYLWPARLNRYIPAPLLALMVGTTILLVVFPEGSATRLGDIPTGFPTPQMPVFELPLLVGMLKSAIVLAVLGAIDSLLTSLVADNKTRTHHDSDRELIGQGIGNTVAGLFGGLPGAGATMRTVVNIRAGGQTPLSGALHALILLAIVLGAGSMAENIPHAVLAGILFKVGVDIIDWDFLKRLHRVPRASVVIMFMVLLITVFIDLIYAVGVGVVTASMLMVKRMTDLQLESMQMITGREAEMKLSVEEAAIMQRAGGRILLYQISGPVSFGAARGMTRALAGADDYRLLLLDLSAVPVIDTTSAKAVEDIIYDTQTAGREIIVAGANEKILDILERMDISALLPPGHLIETRLEALRMADLKRESLAESTG